jgi:hypothetical protein
MTVPKRDLKAYSAVVGAPFDLVGSWANELGSVMVIDAVADGVVSGSYRSSVSQDQTPTGGRLTGLVAGDAVGFVVNWAPRFPAITTWAGKLLAGPAGEPCIHCVWQLSGPMRNPSSWWESFLTGADTFWPVEG